jgi:hypothetical protein
MHALMKTTPPDKVGIGSIEDRGAELYGFLSPRVWIVCRCCLPCPLSHLTLRARPLPWSWLGHARPPRDLREP